MKAIIVNSGARWMDGEPRRELLDWATALGVNTTTALPRFVLVGAEEGCLAYFGVKRQVDGHDVLDRDNNRVVADFDLAIPVPTGSWPQWFGEPVEVPDIAPALLLEVLYDAQGADYQVQDSVSRHFGETTRA